MSSRNSILQTVRADFTTQRRQERGTHAGLWLDKYIGDQSREQKESRSTFIREVALTPVPKMYEEFFTSWKEMLKEYKAESRKAQVDGRMILGLGSESVLETSIALQRTYGVPYIPGSALKGLAASYVLRYLGSEWKPELEDGAFKTVFGDTTDAGYITFFDALYIPDTGYKGQPLYPDVITVHHQDYYGGSSAPTDMDSPNPIPFLSATGTYLVALAAPEITDNAERKAWINATFAILKSALKTMGIGAKTSSGYGRLELEDEPVDPEMSRVEGYIRELESLKSSDVAGRINDYYRRWQQTQSQEARTLLARAIIEKVRQAGREKVSADRTWYKDLREFLDKL